MWKDFIQNIVEQAAVPLYVENIWKPNVYAISQKKSANDEIFTSLWKYFNFLLC